MRNIVAKLSEAAYQAGLTAYAKANEAGRLPDDCLYIAIEAAQQEDRSTIGKKQVSELPEAQQEEAGDIGKDLQLMADVLRTRKSWANSIPVHGDSIADDFETAAKYLEKAKAITAKRTPVSLAEGDVVAFLHGTAPLDGVWFGDKHPTEKGAFWWRKHLRATTIPVSLEAAAKAILQGFWSHIPEAAKIKARRDAKACAAAWNLEVKE